jgi:dihydroorotate dehydrogenase (fumarate)
MADLKASYMGIELKNPVVAGACDLTANLDTIKKIEDAGAGALVLKSLFEEQIQLEQARFDEEMQQFDDLHAEMTDIFPEIEHSGPDEHLLFVMKAKEACDIPVIASLNAVNNTTWTEWAQKLEQTGADGLELNFFANPDLQAAEGATIEQDQISVVKEIASSLKIPVAVKMSVFYTAPLAVAKGFVEAGAKGLVMFNQLFQPDIDPEKESSVVRINLSDKSAHKLPLRYSGMLYGETAAAVIASSGIMDGKDVAKMILAGADAVQVVSTLYRHKVSQLGVMVDELDAWMDSKGYNSLDDFRGKMSRKNSSDPWTYKRAQYVQLLMKSNPMAANR